MPVLRKTMDYLLNLLDEPYNDRFLGLYNFLWDRMRAIRMDLRMQHIFNLEAITMLEQMVFSLFLHTVIIIVYQTCVLMTVGHPVSGYVILYDDHRKKGITVPSEREFRGYYALLKAGQASGIQKLSLDLAKMTPEMRQTPEVLFARDVARACRTGNFIAFFRLARKASYLQACLMHAHFSKEEDIGNLLEYYGFSVKDFEEPYMVKDNAFIN
ncbi:SAC3 family protein B [Sesamum angolense]|uniref:SAC3 family protein B n=1 Tax=Sesamum angolense TaxID=2727404 RepID=A0AAE1X5A9_9LAMI|nr:SAC3 family protein B [Sesamum angolense]